MMSQAATHTTTQHSRVQNGKLFVKDGKVYVKANLSGNGKSFESSSRETSQGVLRKLTTESYGYLLLREREQVFEKIHAEEDMERQIQYFSLYALLFSAIYGFLLGMYSGSFQTIAGAVKFPLLLFGTLFLCLPPLYMVNLLIGIKISFRQTLVLLLGATYVMSALLASLSPVLVFAMLNTTNSDIISLIMLISCAISGAFALHCVWGGMQYLTDRQGGQSHAWIVKIWSVMYMIVGTQLSWGLRPFVGQRGEFVFFQSVGGSFFSAVFELVKGTMLAMF